MTILRGDGPTAPRGDGLTAPCKGRPLVTFPKERFEREFGEELGIPYVADSEEELRRIWSSGTPGVGPNQGFITRRREGPRGDLLLDPDAETMERVGYAFIVAATYLGVDAQGNPLPDVDPKKCREYQFVRRTSKFELRNGDSKYLHFEVVGRKARREVSGPSSLSLLEWDQRGQLPSIRQLDELSRRTHLRVADDYAAGCPIDGDHLCSDDYYRNKDEGDYTQHREWSLRNYDPNDGLYHHYFMKRFDLTPEDGVKKMFYWDNPGRRIDKTARKSYGVHFLNSTDDFDFLMLAESERGDQKIECRMGPWTMTVEQGTEWETRKTVTPPSSCECTEWHKHGATWQLVGEPWGC